jgi:hypothetical protein
LGGGAVLLAVVGGVVGVIWGLSEIQPTAKKPVAAGGGGPVVVGPNPPSVWVDFRQPDGLYSARVPSGFNPVPYTELKPFGSDQVSTLLTLNGGLTCNIKVHVLSPENLAQRIKQEQEEAKRPPFGGVVRQQVSWLGRMVTEETTPTEQFGKVRRTFRDGNKVYEFELGAISQKLTDADKATFFDSVVLGGGR